ncbi:hypothetical protein [Patulibacter sp. SYSU D01012]|uniref:hypothetical protein n=1 Tax=Patulibacter sp. SYSU D01012 TaxID=2817381 RepID=UPI001B3173FF|nr:hypothetical protein [Patulibacter sp. SYSU D01012]
MELPGTRRRSLLRLVVLPTVAAALVAASPADAATFVVGRGAAAAQLRRPGVHVDAWTSATVSATAGRPQGTVLAWTEVTPSKVPHRWWWRTYTSWCSAGRCSRPVKALVSRRAGRRTSENTVTPWRVWVSTDATRDRAVVKAGIRWGARWAIASRRRLVAHGPTDDVWNAGFARLTHTPDGRDWISWNDDDEQVRISPARDGRRLRGPIVARGDTAIARNVGGRWVLLWFERTTEDAGRFPLNAKSAPTVAGLRTVSAAQLTARGDDVLVKLVGPETGPLLGVWRSAAPGDRAQPIRGAWIDSAGTVGPSQALPADRFNLAGVRSLPAPSGGLVLCPWNISAPLGGTFQTQSGACHEDDVDPVRLRGG